MRNIHINDSYKIWKASDMRPIIKEECYKNYNSYFPEVKLNRDFCSMYIEWWLHNIGYYVTKPFCSIKSLNKINLRCKDVDLEEWV